MSAELRVGIKPQEVHFVVPGEFPRELARQVRIEQDSTCQGIDDRNGLPICVFEIIGIGGQRVPASLKSGFNIDTSHYNHNKLSSFYYTKEAVRCQCLACHLLFSEGIGQRGAVKLINSRPLYIEEARRQGGRGKFKVDTSLRRPSDFVIPLYETLYQYGVRWVKDEIEGRNFPVVPEEWMGPGKRKHIVDITKRIYVPKPLDLQFLAAGI